MDFECLWCVKHRFIHGKKNDIIIIMIKNTTVVSNMDNGKGYTWMGAGSIKNSLPSSQFCCKCKTVLKG